MIKKLKKNLWAISFKEFGCSVYLLKRDKKIILIDTGSELNRIELKEDLKKVAIKPEKVNIIILTHNHYDHIKNISLFKNAKIYGSKKDFHENIILDVKKLKIKGIKIIETPGHTEGSICIYIPDEKILFSGDTIFRKGGRGRTDLPGGSEKKLMQSIKKLKELDYDILLPGHL